MSHGWMELIVRCLSILTETYSTMEALNQNVWDLGGGWGELSKQWLILRNERVGLTVEVIRFVSITENEILVLTSAKQQSNHTP